MTKPRSRRGYSSGPSAPWSKLQTTLRTAPSSFFSAWCPASSAAGICGAASWRGFPCTEQPGLISRSLPVSISTRKAGTDVVDTVFAVRQRNSLIIWCRSLISGHRIPVSENREIGGEIGGKLRLPTAYTMTSEADSRHIPCIFPHNRENWASDGPLCLFSELVPHDAYLHHRL